jgi:hypothetical protein
MKIATFDLKGIGPMLHHDVGLANPRTWAYKRLKELHKAKKVKGADADAISDEMARIEFIHGIYWDDTMGPYLPARCFRKALHEAAKATREGKIIERSVYTTLPMFKLHFRDEKIARKGKDAMWESDKFADIRMVTVSTAKVPRCRPIFHEWTLQAQLGYDENTLSDENLLRIARASGMQSGVGDGRAIGFGRFEVTHFNGTPVAEFDEAAAAK